MVERKLTVLQLLPGLESGGVERGTLELAAGLVQAGHRSLVMSGGGQQVSRLTGQGSEHYLWPIGRKSLWTLLLARRLRRLIREQQVDIVHARSRMPAWVAWRALQRMAPASRPHFVTTVHGLYSVGRYSSVMTRGEAVIAVSDAARRYVLKNYPDIDPARVQRIDRGIDPVIYPFGYRPPDSWVNRWYQEHPFLLEQNLLTLPGRITRLKGHLDFLELLARLRQRNLPVYGLIVGGGDASHAGYQREVHRTVERLGLSGHVTFLGHRMDLRDIMAVSNKVFSLSSRHESYGRTVQEALAMGLPVIGYDHGGVGDMLAAIYPHGRVPPGDLDALETTTVQLLEHPLPVEPCVFPGVQEMIERTLSLYKDLVDR